MKLQGTIPEAAAPQRCTKDLPLSRSQGTLVSEEGNVSLELEDSAAMLLKTKQHKNKVNERSVNTTTKYRKVKYKFFPWKNKCEQVSLPMNTVKAYVVSICTVTFRNLGRAEEISTTHTRVAQL